MFTLTIFGILMKHGMNPEWSAQLLSNSKSRRRVIFSIVNDGWRTRRLKTSLDRPL